MPGSRNAVSGASTLRRYTIHVRQIGVRFRSGGSSQLDGHSFLSLLQGAQFLHHRGTALDESQEIADLPAELGLLLQRQRSLPGAALAVGSVYLSHI